MTAAPPCVDALPPRLRSKIRLEQAPTNPPRPISGPCWMWTASGSRYGLIRHGGGTRVAHRVVYELLVGPVPDGLELDHLCRVKYCCSPMHLEPVTHQVNVDRAKPLEGRPRWTHCPKGHELAGENVKIKERRGYVERTCGTCARRRSRERMRRVRAALREQASA